MMWKKIENLDYQQNFNGNKHNTERNKKILLWFTVKSWFLTTSQLTLDEQNALNQVSNWDFLSPLNYSLS